MQYTIWDGFNDSDTPLVDVTAGSLESKVEDVANAHPFDMTQFDMATEVTERESLTVMQLARFLGSSTYVTTINGDIPVA